MTLQEKILYHQIHPLKLAADIGCELASLYFFWCGTGPAVSLAKVRRSIKKKPTALTNSPHSARMIEVISQDRS
jgi:hypothetical protein